MDFSDGVVAGTRGRLEFSVRLFLPGADGGDEGAHVIGGEVAPRGHRRRGASEGDRPEEELIVHDAEYVGAVEVEADAAFAVAAVTAGAVGLVDVPSDPGVFRDGKRLHGSLDFLPRGGGGLPTPQIGQDVVDSLGVEVFPRWHGRAGPSLDDRFGEERIGGHGKESHRVENVADAAFAPAAVTVGAESLVVGAAVPLVAEARIDVAYTGAGRFPLPDRADDPVDFGAGEVSVPFLPGCHLRPAPAVGDDEAVVVVVGHGEGVAVVESRRADAGRFRFETFRPVAGRAVHGVEFLSRGQCGCFERGFIPVRGGRAAAQVEHVRRQGSGVIGCCRCGHHRSGCDVERFPEVFAMPVGRLAGLLLREVGEVEVVAGLVSLEGDVDTEGPALSVEGVAAEATLFSEQVPAPGQEFARLGIAPAIAG